jgi:hypothetical protein
MYLATINALKKDELISRFCMAISLLESQLDNVSSLELKVDNLSESSEEQDNRDERLESGAIRVKFFFEDTVFNMQRLMASPCSNPSVPSYASTVRGKISSSVHHSPYTNSSSRYRKSCIEKRLREYDSKVVR